MKEPSGKSEATPHVRLDKWLWAARFFKTRALAHEAVEGGKVLYNGQRTKPGKEVEPGALIRIRRGLDERTVTVLGVALQRGPATVAMQLYRETDESLRDREQRAELHRAMRTAQLPPARRPNKRDRRRLQEFMQQTQES